MAPWTTATLAVLCDLYLHGIGYNNSTTITSTVLTFILLFRLITYLQPLLQCLLILALKLGLITLVLSLLAMRDVWANFTFPGSIAELISILGNWSMLQQVVRERIGLSFWTMVCVCVCVTLDHFCTALAWWMERMAEEEAWRDVQAWREAEGWEADGEEEWWAGNGGGRA